MMGIYQHAAKTLWINTTNTLNSHLKSIVRVILDVSDWKNPQNHNGVLLPTEPQWGLSTEEVQLLTPTEPQDRRHVTHAFYQEECFQGAPLSPPHWESKALAPVQHAPASCSPLYRAWYSAVWHQFGLVCFGSIQLLPKNANWKSVATAAHVWKKR